MLSIYRDDIKENVATFASPCRPASKFDGIAGPVPATNGSPASKTMLRRDAAFTGSVGRIGEPTPARPCASTPAATPGLCDDRECINTIPLSRRVRRRGRRSREIPDRAPAPSTLRCQPRAKPCPAGPGAVIPVKRTNAVTLTAIAPMTAKMVCQVGEGMAICAIPCVAL